MGSRLQEGFVVVGCQAVCDISTNVSVNILPKWSANFLMALEMLCFVNDKRGQMERGI
jgi:hypothetical protein